jgi:hypothetical protein
MKLLQTNKNNNKKNNNRNDRNQNLLLGLPNKIKTNLNSSSRTFRQRQGTPPFLQGESRGVGWGGRGFSCPDAPAVGGRPFWGAASLGWSPSSSCAASSATPPWPNWEPKGELQRARLRRLWRLRRPVAATQRQRQREGEFREC